MHFDMRIRIACGIFLLALFIGGLTLPLNAQVKIRTSVEDQHDKTMHYFQHGEPIDIQILVEGYQAPIPDVYPYDLVLAVDKSSSMNSESKLSKAKEAATAFVNSINSNPANVGTGSIRIGFVDYGDSVNGIPLTDDYEAIKIAIDKLEAQGGTNLVGAMEEAQQMLKVSTCSRKYIVLITDGGATMPHDDLESAVFGILIPEAVTEHITYYTVGLGVHPEDILKQISSRTDGTFTHLLTPDDLSETLEELHNEVSRIVTTDRLVLHTVLNPDFKLLPNSFRYSHPSAETNADRIGFIQSDALNIDIGRLGNQIQSVKFSVQTKRPFLNPESLKTDTLMIPLLDNYVSYRFREVPYRVNAYQDSIYLLRPPALTVNKKYHDFTNEIELELINNFLDIGSEDKSITGIKLFEYPSIYFQSTNETHPEAKWIIPGENADLVYWDVPSVAPQDTLRMRCNVSVRAFAPRDLNSTGFKVNHTNLKSDVVIGDIFYSRPPYPEETQTRVYENQRLPQRNMLLHALEYHPEGRPDIFIEPAFSQSELRSHRHQTDPRRLALLAADADKIVREWPRTNFIQTTYGFDTPHIWIDSRVNGYADLWEHPAVSLSWEDLPPGQDQLIVSNDGSQNYKVLGQGDLLKCGALNRLCVQLKNTGRMTVDLTPDKLSIEVYNFTSQQWDPFDRYIRFGFRSVLISHAETIVVYGEMPPNALKEHHLEKIRIERSGRAEYWPDIWLARFRVNCMPFEGEAHTSNNISTETVLVVR